MDLKNFLSLLIDYNYTFRQIVFGNSEGNFHLVVTRTDKWLCCWDLLTCSLVWRVFVSVSCLVIEPDSGIIAGFTPEKDCKYNEIGNLKGLSYNFNLD